MSEFLFSARSGKNALTERKVAEFVKAGLPEGKASAILWSSAVKGFGLRLRKGGAASWVLYFRPKGVGRSESARTITLGSYPSLTLKSAEAAAKALVGDIAKGKDPAADRRAERTRERRVLSRALDDYERSLIRRRIVGPKPIMSTLRRGLAPYLSREIDALTRANIVKQIEGLETAGLPGAATDLRKHSRSLLEWAVGQGLAPFNVMAGLRRPRASRAERLEGERVSRALTDDETQALWTSAGSLGSLGGLIKLGLLTGLRRAELASLRWTEVRTDRLVVEAHGAKTGVQHEVWITPAMRAVLAAQSRGASGLVFPGRGGLPMSGWTQLIGRAVKVSGVDFRLHDLRRSARTLMSRCGVAEEVAELAIGHARRGLVGTYNKHQAWASRVEAFERVSAHIAQIIASSAKTLVNEGGPVVALPAMRPKPDRHRRAGAGP
jgi:integrase